MLAIKFSYVCTDALTTGRYSSNNTTQVVQKKTRRFHGKSFYNGKRKEERGEKRE